MGQTQPESVEALFLANIGTSDLGWDETPILDFYQSQGCEGLSLQQALEKASRDSLADSLRCIILQPSIQCIFDKGVNSLKVILFVTQQSVPEPADTAVAFPYLKHLLEKEFKFKLRGHIVRKTISENPSDWQAMYDYYERSLSDLSRVYSPERYAFISVTGGTPAMNNAFFIHAVRLWQTRVHQVYKPRGQTTALVLDTGKRLFRDFMKFQLKALTDSHNYIAAADLAETYQLRSPEEIWLLKARYFRSAFDFKRAKECLEQAGLQGQQALNDVNSLIQRPSKPTLLAELLSNMRQKLDRGEYLDFLSRLYAFSDILARVLFFTSMHLDDSYDKKSRTYPAFQKFLSEHPPLLEKFQEHGWREEPNFLTLPFVFDELLKDPKTPPGTKRLLGKGNKFMEQVKPLIELRNQTIIAHDFGGCSRDDLDEALARGGWSLDELMKKAECIVESLRRAS